MSANFHQDISKTAALVCVATDGQTGKANSTVDVDSYLIDISPRCVANSCP